MNYDLIIIGGGPAGLNAAIYASRAGIKTAIIEKDTPGGKIVKTEQIENFISYEKINGVDLAMSMFNHATSFGAEYLYGNVLKIEKVNETFKVVCDDNTYTSTAVIVATGTKERKIGIPGEDQFYGKGVSYCAICDGGLYKGQDMMVIGGGNSALQEALYLATLANKVYLVHRRDEFRGEDFLAEKVLKQKNIVLELNSVPVEIIGDSKVHQVKIKNVLTNDIKILGVEVVFPFIGFDPVTEFISKDLLDEQKYLVVDENLQSKIPGLFGAGDVIKKELRQIITAASDGALAAINASHYIQKIKENKTTTI